MTALHDIARDALREGASPQLVLMRMLLTGASAVAVQCAVRDLAADDAAAQRVHDLAARHAAGLATLAQVVAAGAAHADAGGPAAAIAQARAMFDRLVAISPEASVAAYSLGDAGLLDQATQDVVAWLRGLGLLAGRPRVLDLGCGIGRFAQALAADARDVLGLDVSPGMVAAARTRCAALPHVRVACCSGEDLAGVGNACVDLVLAVDVFPYLVQGGLPLAERMLTECARVLVPDGHLALLNFSYRARRLDHDDITAMAPRAGLQLRIANERPFRSWDGVAWLLRREAHAG